jgi:hypothetical protein
MNVATTFELLATLELYGHFLTCSFEVLFDEMKVCYNRDLFNIPIK